VVGSSRRQDLNGISFADAANTALSRRQKKWPFLIQLHESQAGEEILCLSGFHPLKSEIQGHKEVCVLQHLLLFEISIFLFTPPQI
jgi:hypothetical protein